jgi:hypothetical protein
MKPLIYILILIIGFIIFKRDPMLLLFLVGAYLIYKFLAGNRHEEERKYFIAMAAMAQNMTKNMNQIVSNLDQINASLERFNKVEPDPFITEADEADEFEH